MVPIWGIGRRPPGLPIPADEPYQPRFSGNMMFRRQAYDPHPGNRPCRPGVVLDQVENTLAEFGDQPFGEMGADALDQPGAQVLLDAVQRGRKRGPHERGLELEAVVTVVLPAPASVDVLAGLDGRGRAEDGDEVPVTPDLHAQDAEAAVGAVEGHALNQPGKGLAFGLGVDLGLHRAANRGSGLGKLVRCAIRVTTIGMAEI